MTTSEIARSEIPKPERTWAMFAHLSSFLGYTCIPLANIIAPLIIWQIKKDDMPFASDQGKECLNFQISMLIYVIISAILTLNPYWLCLPRHSLCDEYHSNHHRSHQGQ